MDNSCFINSYYGICMWSLVLCSVPIQMEPQNEKLKLSQSKMTAKHLMTTLLCIRTFWCQSINKKKEMQSESKERTQLISNMAKERDWRWKNKEKYPNIPWEISPKWIWREMICLPLVAKRAESGTKAQGNVFQKLSQKTYCI